MVRKFASTELEPESSEIDKNSSFPSGAIKKLAELGFLGIIVPEQYEGAGLDTLSYCIIIEEIARVLASISAILISNNALFALPILKYGTEKQKKKILPCLAKGDIIGTFALGEKITAKKLGDKYLISGNKDFVVNAEKANLFIIFARTERNITAFLVERERIKTIEKQEIMGLRASGVCNLKFQEIEVDKASILGIKDEGLKIAEEAFDLTDIGISAQAIGIAQACLDDSLKYSKERHQFGRPICEFGLVQDMLVEMEKRTSGARFLVYDAAIKRDTGVLFSKEKAIARLCATETAMFASTKAIQVYGGYGYIKDYPVERYFRDAKATQVWTRPNDIQKNIIAKELLKS